MDESTRQRFCCLENRIKALEQSDPGNLSLNVTKNPIYTEQILVVEEAGRITTNQSEYSWANGATGIIGVRMSNDWEITGMSFHAGTYPALGTAIVNLYNWNVASTAAVNILSTISLANALDGGGQVNNAHKHVQFPVPIPVPDDAVLGFRSGIITGVISNVRVAVFLRRKIGDVVTDVTL